VEVVVAIKLSIVPVLELLIVVRPATGIKTVQQPHHAQLVLQAPTTFTMVTGCRVCRVNRALQAHSALWVQVHARHTLLARTLLMLVGVGALDWALNRVCGNQTCMQHTTLTRGI
jgi:hypothetical protein